MSIKSIALSLLPIALNVGACVFALSLGNPLLACAAGAVAVLGALSVVLVVS